MKKALALIVIVCFAVQLVAGGKDTTFIKRPYFLGITIGYTQLTHANENNRFQPPVFLNDVQYARQIEFGFSPSIQLSFPFLRRMECEGELRRTTWYGSRSEISEYHYSAPIGHEIVGFRTTRKWYDYTVWQVRCIFSRVVHSKELVMVLVGAGGWLDLNDADKRNNYGLDLQLKCYLQYDHFGNLQLSLFTGANGLDFYGGLRVGYFIKGTRMYRVKPDKYYVRTYED